MLHSHERSLSGTGAVLGGRVCAVAGLIWLAWGSGGLPPVWGLPVLVLGVLVLAAVLGRLRGKGPGRGAGEQPGGPAGARLGRDYWVVVAAEAGVIGGGLAVLDGVLDAPQANAGWIALVVGVHFFFLDRVFPGGGLVPLGAVVSACGLAGLIASAAGASLATATAVAALPAGFALLSSAVLVARRV